MFKNVNMRLAVAIAAALLVADPASATSCNQQRIAAMSNEQAAASIWESSDVIGFGYVSTVDTLAQEQQYIDMVTSLKGGANRRYALQPIRLGRLMPFSTIFRIPARDDQIHFFMLLRTEHGYFPTFCNGVALAKNPLAIIRLLVARAQREARR